MRICNFLKDDATRLGAIEDNTVIDLAMASGNAPEFADTRDFIQGGAAAMELASKA